MSDQTLIITGVTPTGEAVAVQVDENGVVATSGGGGGGGNVNLRDGFGNPVTSSAAGSQRPLDVQLHNSAGNPFGTNASPIRVDPTGTTPQKVTLQSTEYLQSSGNNTSTQLNAGLSFTGAIENALSYPNVIISLRCDQPVTLTVQQFSDAAGTIQYPNIVYTLTANQGFNQSLTLAGSYYRVIVQNTGGSATTNLFLETWLGILNPILNPTNRGNSPSSINEINGNPISLGNNSGANSFPITISTETSTGNITTQNLVPNGAATANSAVEITLNGAASLSIQVTGTYTGALSIQLTNDGNRWETITATSIVNTITGAYTATIASATIGIFQFECGGFLRARITALAAVTGTATITLRATNSSSLVTIDNALPAGSNIIGALTANQTINVAQIGGTTTVNGGLAGTLAIGGGAAHSAASNTNPAQIGGRITPTTIATVDTTLVAGDIAYKPITTGLQAITKNFGTSELDINVAVTPSVTTTTIQGLVAASGTASVRNYITQLNIQTDSLGAAGNMFILDNQGAIGTSVTIATPGVFTSTAHDLKIGDTIIFTALGTITGVTVNTLYYITAANFTATTFSVATSPSSAAIQITGATSAFTFYRVLQLVRFQATTPLSNPIIITPPNPLRGIANANLNVYFPASLTSGAVYINVIGYRGF